MKRTLYFLLVIASVIFFTILFFRINVDFNCSSQYGNCPNDISKSLAGFGGKNIFLSMSLASKYLKANYNVLSYSFRFKLPNIIKVDLILKKPVYAIKGSTQNGLYLVSNDGNILSFVDKTSLPFVQTAENFKVGQKISDSDVFALKIIYGVSQMYQINYGKIESGNLLVDLPHQIRVIFPLEGDSQMLLGALRLIYSKVTQGDSNGKYSQIDLRFKNPVLR